MDARSGHIHIGLLREEIERRKLVEIPDEQAEAIINMNRKQRRAWAAQQRRADRSPHDPTKETGK